MANTVIQIKSSGVTGNVPVSLYPGEIAINYTDGKLYYGDESNNPVLFDVITDPAGLNGEIQFNDSGTFGASDGLSFNKTTEVLTVTNATVGTLNVVPAITSSYTHANSAFNKANTSEILAQAAFDVANTATSASTDQYARNHANSAFNKANTSEILAQAAFDTANTKLDSSSYTANDVLTKIKTVDGSGSGLDADLLDGQSGAYYLDWTNATNKPDPVITLGGDLSGSVTLTDLTSNTLTATVANDSHTHDTRYYTETESDTLFANSTFANVVSQTATSSYNQANTATQYATSAGTYANSAYSQANTATTNAATADQRAVTSGSYANSAYGQANTATQYATSAGSYANSSYSQANTATTNADTADQKAVSAGVYANSAYSQANTANQRAVTSGVYANSAYGQANTATTNAATADQRAVTSGSYANSAFGAANTANQRAVTSGSYANSAYSQANTATTNAATADQKAVTSGVYANSAYGQANTATTNAATADQKAVTSGSYANSAFSAANTADQRAVTSGSYANSAYSQANTATQYATSAALYANSAYSQANAATTNASTADQKAVSAGVYANSAYGQANTKVSKSGDTMTGFLTLHADPTSSLHAATKEYVDTIAAASLHYHDPVRVESPIALTASYNNGSSGVGATLTNTGALAAIVIDGVSLSLNDRVLVYNQSNAAHNGVYYVSNVGSGSVAWVLTRTLDADSYNPSDPSSLGTGDAFYVKEGDTGAGELYVMTTPGTITFGTTEIVFSQISSAQIYSVGSGLSLDGTVFSHSDTSSQASVNNSNGTVIQDITLDGFGHITAIGSLDLDGRYYTETESDSRFINVTGDTMTGDLYFDGSTLWKVSAADTAAQRADARDDATNFSRLHWYGVSDAGATSNFRHAWYDGTNYVNVTVNASGRIDFAGSAATMYIGADRVFDDGYHPNADKWTTARNITLNGDLSGSVSIDGSTNVTLTATVAANSVALGTDTTGNYMADVTAGSGISISHTPSEGSTATITHADTSSQASVNNSGTTYIQDITLDGFGHITAIGSAALPTYDNYVSWTAEDGDGTQYTVTSGDTLKFAEGTGLDVNFTADDVLTFSHADTSSQTSVDNSNGTVIQDITLDGFGHITAIGSVDLDSRYVNVAGDTMTGSLFFSTTAIDVDSYASSSGGFGNIQDGSGWGARGLFIHGGGTGDAAAIGHNGSGLYFGIQNGSAANSLTNWLEVSPARAISFSGTGLTYNSNNVFHDGYHPNADKWTTARTNTVTLTGDVTGTANASVDGSANWTVSIATTVADDSHSHSNYVLKAGDTMSGTLNMNNNNITNVNHITIADPGPGEGIQWLTGSNWQIFESPDDMTTNSGGNLQFATGTTYRFRVDTSGNSFSSSSSRAPIFYDSDDTAYYVNPASESNIGTIRIGGAIQYTTGGAAKVSIYDAGTGTTPALTIGASNNDLVYFRRLSAGSYQWQTYNSGNSGSLLFQPYGGNVGIGTTSPNAKVEIVNTSAGAVATQLFLHNASDTDGTGARLDFAGLAAGTIPTGSISNIRTGSGAYALTFNNYGGGSNAERLRITSTGNVGIGTTSPSGRLDIQENTTSSLLTRVWNTNTSGTGSAILRLANSGNGANGTRIELTDSTYYVATIAADRTEGLKFFVGQMASALTTERVRIDINGNVGVGTSSPSAKLTAVGTVKSASLTQSAFYLSNATQTSGFLLGRSLASDDAQNFFIYDTVGASTRLYLDSSGNVGVGTSSPAYKLDVNGNIRGEGLERSAAGDVYISHSGAYSVTFRTNNSEKMRITSDGNVGIGTTSPGSGANPGTLAVQTTQDFGISIFRNSTNPSQIAFLDNNNNAAIGTNGSNSLVFCNNSRTSERMRIDSSGNVGIGTTSPSAKLSVEGTVVGNIATFFNDGNSTNSKGIKIQGGTDNGFGENYKIEFFDGDGTASGRISTNTGAVLLEGASFVFNDAGADYDFRVESDTIVNALFVEGSSGNVGIGTGSPANLLHISGSAATLEIDSSTNTANLDFDNSTQTARIQLANNDFVTLVGGTERMRIDSSGNVGIGTGSPARKLHVQSSGETARFQSTSSVAEVRLYSTGPDYSAIGHTGDLYFAVGSAERMRINSSGNVGIGTSSPQTKLDIRGTSATVSSTIQIVGNSVSTLLLGQNATGGVIRGQGGNNALSFWTGGSGDTAASGSGTERVRITSTGDVGIGTTTPGYKLEVNGSFAATTKSFLIPHPTKPGKKLRYGSLEGPENGVYVRGKIKGNVIELPDYWTALVDPDSITVQLTAIGKGQKLYVEDIRDNKVYIANDGVFAGEPNCFYFVQAERVDVDKLQVEID